MGNARPGPGDSLFVRIVAFSFMAIVLAVVFIGQFVFSAQVNSFLLAGSMVTTFSLLAGYNRIVRGAFLPGLKRKAPANSPGATYPEVLNSRFSRIVALSFVGLVIVLALVGPFAFSWHVEGGLIAATVLVALTLIFGYSRIVKGTFYSGLKDKTHSNDC
jgi:hypothetical protein